MNKSRPEAEPRLPIKLEPTSNGEYTPPASTAVLRHVQRSALQSAAESARRLGISRRAFLQSSAGSATVLLAMNQLSACGGGSYQVPPSAAQHPAEAASVVDGDELIFDVQTHHVDAERKWWLHNPPNLTELLKSTPQGRCGSEFYVKCFDGDHYLKEVFLDSDTDMAVVSALWGTPEMNPLSIEEAVKTRERFERMEGSPRLLLHGVVWGKAQSPAQTAERMRWLVEQQRIAAFKLYPVWRRLGLACCTAPGA